MPLLQRLRRMGMVITGSQKVADAILRDAFSQASDALSHVDGLDEDDIFKLGFDAFDDAVHRKGTVVLLGRPAERDGSLSSGVRNLTYVERVAIALLVLEDMSIRQAAILSARPPQVLEAALSDGLKKLDAEGF